MQQLSPRDAFGGLAPVAVLRRYPWDLPCARAHADNSAASASVLTPYGLRGTGQQIVMSAPQMAGGALTTAAATSSWGLTAAAIPIIGAAVAGVTIGLMLLFGRKGPKQKVATTEVVNTAEPQFQANLAAYLSGPRTLSSQAQALANFEALWTWVVQHCQIPEYGTPGQRCVSDRQRGGQWDWFSYYYDPIAGDPNVQPDPTVIEQAGATVSSVVSSIFGTTAAATGAPLMALAAVALLLVLAFSFGGGK
jgi:hypothetical protein